LIVTVLSTLSATKSVAPHQGWCGLIHAYSEYLPVSDKTPIITLHEGNTPLIPLLGVSDRLGRGIKVWAKSTRPVLSDTERRARGMGERIGKF